MEIDNDENENMATPFFDPKLEREFCPLIKRCSSDERNRQYMGELWAAYGPYAQPDFHRTILTNEEKSFSLMWEMHLAHQFVTHGFTLCKTRNEEPDLRLDINGQTVWVECCVPGKGDSEPKQVDGVEIHKSNYGKPYTIELEPIFLRWTSILKDKFEQYQNRIQAELCTPNQPYIIAINGHRAGRPYRRGEEPPKILGVLYGIQGFVNHFDENGRENLDYSITESIENNNGASVSTCFFRCGNHKGITGVIYTQDSPFLIKGGKDYFYAENVLSPHRGDFGFGCFMGTLDDLPIPITP